VAPLKAAAEKPLGRLTSSAIQSPRFCAGSRIAIDIDCDTAGPAIDVHIHVRRRSIGFNRRTIVDPRRGGVGVIELALGLGPLRVFQLALLLDDILIALSGGVFDATFLLRDPLTGILLG